MLAESTALAQTQVARAMLKLLRFEALLAVLSACFLADLPLHFDFLQEQWVRRL